MASPVASSQKSLKPDKGSVTVFLESATLGEESGDWSIILPELVVS